MRMPDWIAVQQMDDTNRLIRVLLLSDPYLSNLSDRGSML
jgi:hypothetical protein